MPRGSEHVLRWLMVTAASSFALMGCATGGGGPGASGSAADSPRETVADERPAHRKLGYRLEWRGFPVVASRASIVSIEPRDDLVLVKDSANTLSAVETGTGVNRWAAQVGERLDRVLGTARTAAGDVLVSSDTEISIYDEKTGTLEDRQAYGLLVSTAPVVMGRDVAVGTEIGQLLTHNLMSGFRQSAYDFGATFDVAPVRVGEFVAGVARNGRVFILDPRTGSSVGRTLVYGRASVRPAASDDALFVASRDQSLWAFEARGAGTRWRLRTPGPITHAPVYADGVVYCALPGRGLTAVDASSGDVLWSVEGVFADAVCRRRDRIIAWDGERIYAIQGSSGDVMDSFELPGVSIVKADAFDEGNLYTVHTSDGELRRHTPIR